jgi:DNA-directed RNA polymerase specialized sigma24 family protein
MHTSEADAAVEALDDRSLRVRLARKDWRNDPLFIPDEQVFSQFRVARAKDDKARLGLLAEALNERLLEHSRKFALKMRMVPGLIDDPRRAALEIASCTWEHLLASASDAAHAEKAFGQFFKRRALDFFKGLLAKKRKLQASLDSEDDDEDEVSATDDLEELKDFNTPDLLAARQQEFDRANARLLEILTQKEYTTFTLLNCDNWQVQEVAAALKVTVKSVNNYKRSALAKIDKEFKQ